MDEDELRQFFKECDLMPANHEVEHAFDLVFKGTSIIITPKDVNNK